MVWPVDSHRLIHMYHTPQNRVKYELCNISLFSLILHSYQPINSIYVSHITLYTITAYTIDPNRHNPPTIPPYLPALPLEAFSAASLFALSNSKVPTFS